MIAGFVDRARGGRPRTSTSTAINIHATTMTAVGVLSVTDITLRQNHYVPALHTPTTVLVLTLATLIVAVAGAALGGKLVYRRGVGVASVALAAGEMPAARERPAVLDTRQGASDAL